MNERIATPSHCRAGDGLTLCVRVVATGLEIGTPHLEHPVVKHHIYRRCQVEREADRYLQNPIAALHNLLAQGAAFWAEDVACTLRMLEIDQVLRILR